VGAVGLFAPGSAVRRRGSIEAVAATAESAAEEVRLRPRREGRRAHCEAVVVG